jgi:hypothetical protein
MSGYGGKYLPVNKLDIKKSGSMKKMFLISKILLLAFSCTQLTDEEKMIKETLGKTVEIGMFESVRQGDREIPFELKDNSCQEVK